MHSALAIIFFLTNPYLDLLAFVAFLSLTTFFLLQFISSSTCLCSRFGTWPVAMLAQSKNKAILEGPVCNRTQVIGWHTNEKSKRLRRFHVDMSGFAFNSTILWDPKRWRRPTSRPVRQLDAVKEGFQVWFMLLSYRSLLQCHLEFATCCRITLLYVLCTDFCFFLGNNFYRTSGGRWISNGRYTSWLFKNYELASAFGSSQFCLSQRMEA